MILIEPVQSIGNQKRPYLIAPVIENTTLPVGMKPLSGIGMIIEMRAVKICQTVCIIGKMAGHPVENQADASLMEAVNQKFEILGQPKAAGWRKVARNLVAPARKIRMLHDRKQFDMREPHFLDIVHQLCCEFAVAQ